MQSIQCHPFLDQSKVIAATRKQGMAVTAYSPIARGSAKDDALLCASARRMQECRARVPALARQRASS